MTMEFVVSLLVRGALVLAATWIGVLLLRRASAAHRHLAWALGAAALLALPALTPTLPALRLPLLPCETGATVSRSGATRPTPVVANPPTSSPVAPSPRGGATIAPLVAAHTATPATPPTPTRSAVSAPVSVPASAPTRQWPTVLVGIWLAGAVVVALRLVVAVHATRRLVRRAQPMSDESVIALVGETLGRRLVPDALRLRVSEDVDAPVTVGAFRPYVLLPAAALAWPRERLRLALVHEFAHVGRNDLLAEFAARLSLVVHWPDPLAWYALARMRVERERACDDRVLCSGSAATDYADFLVSLTRALRRGPSFVGIAATMAAGPRLEHRVRAILDVQRSRRGPSRRSRLAFVATGGVLLSFAACVQPARVDVGTPPAPLPGTADRQPITREDAPAVLVLTVAADGTGQFTTISAALVAAPDGAVVRVGPGTYEEHVVVTRPVTIEGAGAELTTITSVVESPEVLQAVWAEYRQQVEAATTDAERTALGAGLRLRQVAALRPTLRVAGTRDVVVKALTLTGRGDHPEGGVAAGSVVDVVGAGLRIEDAAIVGSPGSGVTIREGANVQIDRCLVAGIWGTGIAVGPADGRPCEVRVDRSDIRNCRHRGIAIAAGNSAVTIEGCRISGSSWHGIRYDDAAPTVRDNLIFGNVRSGIYASGRTEGDISGNLFFENAMSDVSCWFEARDRIRENTFVRSQREAVAILGAANPVVRQNVFAECRTAIVGSSVGDVRASGTYAHGGTVEANLFWQNGALFTVPSKDGPGLAEAPLPSGNLIVDPGFTDVAGRDFTFAADSPALRAGAGAAHPPGFASPWAPRPEESACSPAAVSPFRPTRDSGPTHVIGPAATGNHPRPLADVKADILQITDPERRERGLVALAEALRGDDPRVVAGALAALFVIRDVAYDKRRFRDDVMRGLESPDAGVQRAAAYALVQVEREPEDIDRLLTIADAAGTPPRHLLHVATMLSGNRVEGRLADLFVRALAVDETPRSAMDTANTLRGMWVSPETEDAVVAAWRRGATDPRQNAALWPYILGQMRPNARESRVRAVFELFARGDDGARQLAGVAVVRPVDESARPLAANLAAEALTTGVTAAFARTYLDVIRVNGRADQIPALREFAANDMIGDELRQAATEVADQLLRQR